MKKYIYGIASLFIILPVIIFILSFLKIYISLPISVLILYLYYKLVRNEKITEESETRKFNFKYYGIVSIIILLWVIFSGIGSISYQNNDFAVRNAVFRDLINERWPVYFQFDKYMADIIGTEQAGFVYYFTYWLPVALIGKLFGENIANIALVIWSFLQIMFVIYLLNIRFKKDSIWTVLLLLGFSGMDILGSRHIIMLFTDRHLEWWAGFIQYTSNTAQLYWVFNQCIPIWLVTTLILSFKKNSSVILIAPLLFCYSPFATIGIIPIVIYILIKNILNKKDTIKNTVLLPEIIIPIIILIIFGTFYLSADSSISVRGTAMQVKRVSIEYFSKLYIKFCLIEFIPYFIILYKKNKKNGIYWLIGTELLIIPIYYMTPSNDFCMRVSLPALFILMMLLIKYMNELDEKINLKNIFIIIILLISFISPEHEIIRSIRSTFTEERATYIKDNKIYSISSPKTQEGLNICKRQFYAKNYETKFFWKYLAK